MVANTFSFRPAVPAQASHYSDRRDSPRRHISMRVTAVASDDNTVDSHKRICSLELLNLSDSGLAAIVQQPLDPGTRLALFFPPHGPEQGFDLFGTIVRCQRNNDNLPVIGVRLDRRIAA